LFAIADETNFPVTRLRKGAVCASIAQILHFKLQDLTASCPAPHSRSLPRFTPEPIYSLTAKIAKIRHPNLFSDCYVSAVVNLLGRVAGRCLNLSAVRGTEIRCVQLID
jgi:hypothetical protein